MTGQRAAAEPYATRFETEVTSIDGRRVWLERSHFYGASGGQPADRGTIGDIDVVDVELIDGEPVHRLAVEPSFRPGHRVLCSVDWSFRMYCMGPTPPVTFSPGRPRDCWTVRQLPGSKSGRRRSPSTSKRARPSTTKP